jgi:hypothetical protein
LRTLGQRDTLQGAVGHESKLLESDFMGKLFVSMKHKADPMSVLMQANYSH